MVYEVKHLAERLVSGWPILARPSRDASRIAGGAAKHGAGQTRRRRNGAAAKRGDGETRRAAVSFSRRRHADANGRRRYNGNDRRRTGDG